MFKNIKSINIFVENFTDEEKDTLEANIRREYFQHLSYLESIGDKIKNIEEFEAEDNRYAELSKKYGSNKQLAELEKIEKKEQHQRILEEKYGFGKAYSILQLFERYEELSATSPTQDIARIEEIEKIIVYLLVSWKKSEWGLTFEQTEQNHALHIAFIKKHGLDSKIYEFEKQQNEKKIARESEEKRIELEKKYGKGKSLEELIKLENDVKWRAELERKYGKGKSLEELIKLENDEKMRNECMRNHERMLREEEIRKKNQIIF